MKRKTTPEFIQAAIAVHGDKYDYSQTEYVGARQKLKIICPKHGFFEQVPFAHLRGNGCAKCAGIGKKTTEDFIEKSRQVHGDKYDYSKSEYIGSDNNITIICPKHGDFNQVAYHHQAGVGCPLCGREKLSDLFSDNKESFIQKAISVHGDKYGYEHVEYQNSWTKIKIECSDHGFFEQVPNSHLRGSGCPKCAVYGTVQLTTENFIEKSRQVHGDKYDYSKSEYIGSNNKIVITCTKHGDFEQKASHHQVGIGCPRCGKDKLSNLFRFDKESFIQKAISVHGDKYGYEHVEYQNSWTKIKIECSDHGFFEQVPNSHLRGSGCPKCGEHGFNTRLPSIIYFLKFQTQIAAFWKIGITNRSVKERFRTDYKSIKLGWTWAGDGSIIWDTEKELLREYKDYKFDYLFRLLQDGGDTECFTLDLPVKKIIKTITQKLQNPPEIINGGQQQGDL